MAPARLLGSPKPALTATGTGLDVDRRRAPRTVAGEGGPLTIEVDSRVDAAAPEMNAKEGPGPGAI